MGFPMSSTSLYQFESVWLQTDDEFDRVSDNLDAIYYGLSKHKRQCLHWCVEGLRDKWRSFQESTLSVDHQMKREKKCVQFSELLAGIILHFNQNFFHDLEQIDSFLGSRREWSEFTLKFSTLRRFEEVFEEFLKVFAEFVTSGLESAHTVVVSALALLSYLYRYLIGCVDKVGGKTYSPGSFFFRLIFVAIVLFLGSYVWIKFRQASFTANRRKRKLGDEADVQAGGVYRRAVKNSRGEFTHYKYEPRFKPLREKTQSGSPLSFNCLSLCSYHTRREAEIVRHIAAVLYGEEEGRPVQFEDGLCLPFPSVTERENCPSFGKEKAVWVTRRTKELYAELLKERARRLQLLRPAVETRGSHHDHADEASRLDPSPSALVAPCTAIDLTCFTSSRGGNGFLEQATTSESQGIGQEAPLAREELSASFSDCDFDEVLSSMLHGEENDSPRMDQMEGDYSAADCVLGFESTLVPPRSSALDNPTSAIFATRPQLGVGDQVLEIIEPHLNSATAITFQQLESLPEQVQLQLRVTCQETRPEEFPGSNVELQQRLLKSEERSSELEQKLFQSEVENEKWRSMFRQLAKLI